VNLSFRLSVGTDAAAICNRQRYAILFRFRLRGRMTIENRRHGISTQSRNERPFTRFDFQSERTSRRFAIANAMQFPIDLHNIQIPS